MSLERLARPRLSAALRNKLPHPCGSDLPHCVHFIGDDIAHSLVKTGAVVEYGGPWRRSSIEGTAAVIPLAQVHGVAS